jgi:anaphase-promoting complex subunit 8
LDKFRPETCKVLANFYSSQNKHTEAIKYLYRALMLNSKDFSIWILLGHEYMELKNEQAALQCYKNSTGDFSLDL